MSNKTIANKTLIFAMIALGALTLLAGCSDDDPATPGNTSETFTLTIANVSAPADYATSGVFNTPVDASGPAPIFPGEAYEFIFGANPGDKLSFATMFVQSNDLFYAPMGTGIALFNGMTPVNGDVTDQIHLWDSGTELNEEPGVGTNQAPRQSGANTGAVDTDTTVRMVNDGFTYPAASDVIAVTITHLGDHLFRTRIENVSDAGTLMTSGGSVAVPLAPGVFVIHTNNDPLFTAGMADMLGLEGLAEDGDPSVLFAALEAHTGLAVPLAPGVAVVHSDQVSLFTAGAANGGLGLEALAEDGDPSGLVSSLTGGAGIASVAVFNTPVGGMAAAPIFPGESYQITFTAEPGDRLSLATMFVQSNDLFYAFDAAGLELFDAMGSAVIGDVTGQMALWDAGTEMNQWPAVGPDQAPRQTGANTGASDADNTVRMVNDGYNYPATSQVIRVSLSLGS
jgi:hypothetical protein|nr:spondin domain-containing protein [Candidatus Krumholzibacteria bacterium]